MIKYFAFYISLVSILPFLLFGCNSATQQTEATKAPTPSSTEVSNTVESPSPVESTPPVIASAKKIAPGELFKLGFDNKVRVEIVRVNRIQSRQTGKQDLVNVQFRVRRTGDGFTDSDAIDASRITGRNQEDSSVYNADNQNHTNNTILLKDLKKGASVDAYAWLPVAEGVKSMEITIPGVEPFKDVPVEEWQEQIAKTNDKIESGKYIQPSFENRAKVELLQVNRVKDGKNKGKVHVRFRVTRTGDKVFDNDAFKSNEITATNIDTNEVYRVSVEGSAINYTSIILNKLEPGKSVEASTLIESPDDVHSFNINVPSTQSFKNVPIE